MLLILGVVIAVVTTMLVKPLGAMITLKFMTLTRDAEECEGGEQQGKAFHCGGI